ncbi:hypothetical protein [Cyanobium gracile]|uniref:Uncharacterized protein n=1 Tax=Cyanobium gracile (strain ATCC 27147 / PCC 6307) TaxID=292564 RepID=K9PAM4_CYAGP|nr:hypothetical protein [Cyanobium gracile]AFY30180.1 hypothetical protein Cyagr_3100 [Cyanobium gracile PCC 6307]
MSETLSGSVDDGVSSGTTSFRFRPVGPGRFFVAGFLSLWLCGWLAGEVFALWALWRILAAFLASGEGPLPVALFLLVWLGLWSVGGIVALREVLRALWSEDRLTVSADGELERLVQRGPFRRRRALSGREIRCFQVRAAGVGAGPLVAELPGRSIEITRLGSLRQRREAADQLNRRLGLRPLPEDPAPAPGPHQIPAAAVLPAGWQELTPSFGSPLLVPDLALRRQQRLVMGLVNLVLWGLLALLLQNGRAGPGFWALGVPLALVALAGGWGLLWLALGRLEWRLEPRVLVLQRRFGNRLRTLGEARALELVERVDSDGDRSYRLQGTRPPDPPLRVEDHASDPTSLRHLGAWLAARSRVPFEDRVPSEEQRRQQRAEMERLRQQLAGSGRFGRWAARQLEGPDA